MSQPEIARLRHAQERICPQCGARVAQRARACFFCSASLEDAPRRHFSIPWADIVLFAVIGGLVAIWWLRPPVGTDRPHLSLLDKGASVAMAQQNIAGTANSKSANQDAASEDPQVVEAPVVLPTATASPTAPPPSPTPTSTSTATVPPEPSATPQTYRVRGGDSVQVIAERTNSTVNAIVEANGLGSDMMIHPGDMLVIPAATGGQASVPAGPAPTATPTGGTLIYRVSAGDTVGGIAARFGSTVDWVLAANNMSANDYIQVGQALTIPLSNNTPQPAATETPAPAAEATATPTREAQYRAPIPVSPADTSTIASDSDVLLSWASVGVLAEEEWYVVMLMGPDGKPAPVPPYWTKSTSWRLPRDYRGAAATNDERPAGEVGAASVQAPTTDGIEYTWLVQVVAGKPGKPGPTLSPPSPPRKFTWR